MFLFRLLLNSDLLCPITINNGNVNEAECNRRIYSECPYTCKQGFDPNPKQTKVKCQVNGTWSNDEEPYCLGIFNVIDIFMTIHLLSILAVPCYSLD